MKQILITGGAGFIGSHISRRLLHEGNRITIVDDLSTGKRANVEDLLGHEYCTLIEHDVMNPLPGLSYAPDQIYNLACPASPPQYQKDPIRTLMINIFGAKHALELAEQAGATLLQASTSEVYGDPIQHPQAESYTGNVNAIGPRACYDEGKRAAETLCFDYHRQRGVKIKVARIFNTYGPAMDKHDGRVVTNFIHQALEGHGLTLYGDGQQTRSFCYVDDMVDGLIALMNSADGITGPVNLGNPDEFTIEELAELVLELTASGSTLEYKPLPQDDPMQRQPDISLAKQLLNWQPQVKLRKGLEKTIAAARKEALAA
ncbi:MAG: UDP-glucuronic acid decarboxylase family protein [Alphaproteobacteria bacterium]